MKSFALLTSAIALSSLLGSAAVAQQQSGVAADYSLRLMKNCVVVSEHAMNQHQIDTYRALKDEEVIMEELEGPIDEIQEQIEHYSDEIEHYSDLAFQETDNTIHIDKGYMQQQQHYVELLDVLMDAHEEDFAALGRQGRVIGEVAEAFEDAMQITLQGKDYDFVQVVTPDSDLQHINCQPDGIIYIDDV